MTEGFYIMSARRYMLTPTGATTSRDSGRLISVGEKVLSNDNMNSLISVIDMSKVEGSS